MLCVFLKHITKYEVSVPRTIVPSGSNFEEFKQLFKSQALKLIGTLVNILALKETVANLFYRKITIRNLRKI